MHSCRILLDNHSDNLHSYPPTITTQMLSNGVEEHEKQHNFGHLHNAFDLRNHFICGRKWSQNNQ